MVSMSAEQAKTSALARFQAPAPGHINCGQAVYLYALLRLGEDGEAITQARYFGGGITGMGEICGVLNGTALALGARDQILAERGIDAPQATADQLKSILRDFSEEFGSRRCGNLTGYDLSTPEGMAAFKMSEIRSRCSDYVAWAIDRLEPLLEPAIEAYGSIQNEDMPTGCDGCGRGKDAGSARSGATGATEDDASDRPARTRRPQLHSESSS